MRFFLRGTLLVVLAFSATRPAEAQAWRAAAEARIEQHRKGTFHFVIRDENGTPIPGAAVKATMKRHAFGFGTAVTVSMMANTQVPQYREKLANLTGDGRTFNRAVFGNALKWPYWENTNTTSKQIITTQILWLRSRGMEVRGHTLLWPAWRWMPNDIEANKSDPAYIKQRIQSHIGATAGYRGLKGNLIDWDVVNEPVHLTDIREAFKGQAGYPTGEEIYAEAFAWAAQADPDARLYINDYNIISNYNTSWQAGTRQSYRQIITRLIDAGAPLHGIGMQGHMSPGSATTPDNAYRVLEEFAVFDKALAITEYDYAYSDNNQSGTCRKADEAVAGAYLRDFLTVVFSHPSVESFTMWGFWDGDHWRCDAAMFRQDWSLKPSGEAFIDLVFNQWWTDETVTTGADGRATLRGFLGDYDISVELPDGSVSRAVTLSTTDTLVVAFPPSTTSSERDEIIASDIVVTSYPNPFAQHTAIRYGLPAPAHVRLEVYDLLGRRVAVLADVEQPAGWHEAPFDADALGSGVYFYRLQTGSQAVMGTMLRQ